MGVKKSTIGRMTLELAMAFWRNEANFGRHGLTLLLVDHK
jgi:hypothetical protein